MWPDMEAIFRLDENALELIIRTSIMYIGLLVALRTFGRRETGALELPELLMVVLIADGVQNGMAGDYQSVTGAVIVAGTLLAWNIFLDWLAYASPTARALLRPKPLNLVEDGAYLRHHMRRELVTKEELDALLRIEGVEDVRDVKLARLEPSGELSVIRRDQETHGNQHKRRRSGL